MNRNLIQNSIYGFVGMIGLSTWLAGMTPAQSNLAISPLHSASSQENHQGWCQQQSGNWKENSCEWEQREVDEPKETLLSQECRRQSGVWQTLFEETYVPRCYGGLCLPMYDLLSLEYTEKGVSCTWNPEIEPGL